MGLLLPAPSVGTQWGSPTTPHEAETFLCVLPSPRHHFLAIFTPQGAPCPAQKLSCCAGGSGRLLHIPPGFSKGTKPLAPQGHTICSIISTLSTSPGMGFKRREKFLLWKLKCTADLKLNHIGESNYSENGMASCVYSMGKGKKGANAGYEM